MKIELGIKGDYDVNYFAWNTNIEILIKKPNQCFRRQTQPLILKM